MDEETGRISDAQLKKSSEDAKFSYCDLLSHRALKEDHEVLIPSTEMKIDTRRQVAYCSFPSPVECNGDIRIVIKLITLTSERNAFVWFNSQFITDAVTVFSEYEVDRSKSSLSHSGMDSSSSSSLTSYSSTTQDTTPDSSSVSIPMVSRQSSFNLFSSTAASPMPEEGEREFFIRCVFSDASLSETDESYRWRIEKENADRLGTEDVVEHSASKPMSLLQKAGSQLFTSTRNLISRVSSTSGGLLRSNSATPSRQSSEPSSPSHSVHGHGEEVSIELKEMRETGSGVQLREQAEIERRKQMRLHSLHESDELTLSASTANGDTAKSDELTLSASTANGDTAKSEEVTPLRAIDESPNDSSDEIQLGSDEGESHSQS